MRRLSVLPILLCAGILVLAATGCPPKPIPETKTTATPPPATVDPAPAEPGDTADPPATGGADATNPAATTDAAAAGDEVAKAFYNDNCAKCHGANGEGIPEKGPAYEKVAAEPEAEWVHKILEGEPDKMPAFKEQLSEEQATALAAWVRKTFVPAVL